MKWFLGKVLGIVEPSSKSQELGSEVHDQVAEPWSKGLITTEDVDAMALGTGLLAQAARTFRPLIPKLPKPGTYDVESWAKGAVPAGVGSDGTRLWMPFVGKIDLWRWPAVSPTLPELPGWDPDRLHIHDHKTSSDPMKWGKTAEELEHDIQMLGYAAVLARAFPDAPKPSRIDVSHGYMATRGMPYGHMVMAYNVPWDNVEEVWEDYCAVAVEQHAIITGYHAGTVRETDIRCNEGACGDYGGCYYRERCTQTRAKVRSTFGAFSNPNIAAHKGTNPPNRACSALRKARTPPPTRTPPWP